MGNAKGWFRSLTPKKAWDHYVDMPVEIFLSNFREDGYVDVENDVEKMCRHYAREVPGTFNILLSLKQIELIAELLAQYIREYVMGKGGFDRLEMYALEELDLMMTEQVDFILRYLKR